LVAACKAYGVMLRTDSEVARVDISGGTVHGVTLTSGEALLAPVVAAACDPKQLFLQLVRPQLLSHRFESGIKNIRARGTVAKIHLAVDGYPQIKGRPGFNAALIRTGERLDDLERAFDAVKYRAFSPAPVLEVYAPTLEDASLAPAGKHVLSVLVHFAPYRLETGWTAAKKSELYALAVAALAAVMPDVRSRILANEVLTPADVEARFNLSGGHMFHGEHAADQLLVRPVPDCARYATPFKGLFLCGSGSHPGGGITGAPGLLAAKAILG
jgi:phytoene dehydrogenase-like protein